MRIKVVLSIVALVAVVVFAAVAAAGKNGNGSSVGSAQVFVPNPGPEPGRRVAHRPEGFGRAVPAAAYHAVQLTNLDGSGFLRGDYANVYSSTGNLAFSPTNTFAYTRHQDEFEQVMAYYWMTEAQKYIQRSRLRRRVCRRSTTSHRTPGSTSSAPTTRSRPTIRRTSCASARAASTTPRTPR